MLLASGTVTDRRENSRLGHRVPITRAERRSSATYSQLGLNGIFSAADFLYTRPGMALLRSVATVGSYTAMSRVFGFVRDILTAAILGAGPVADAFFVAQRLPNLFRSLFAEGAFSAAFVPLFAGTMAEHGKEPARIFAEDALAVLLAALLGFVLLGEIFMPTVMDVIAPGFRQDPEKFELAVDARPDHLSLSVVHRAGRASGRGVELGRAFRRRRCDPDPAEFVPDRSIVADAAVWLARWPRAGLGGHCGRVCPVSVAVVACAARRVGIAAAVAAADRQVCAAPWR